MLSSALEHVVPEQMFSTPTAPVSAISAVKALQIAAQQGIPVHHINASNAATVVPLLNIDALALEEIQAAIAVGKEVTVSQSNITEAGWTGVGYIITDPVTGSGAYKISTGKNGSALPVGVGFGVMFSALVAEVALLMTAESPVKLILGAGMTPASVSVIMASIVVFIAAFMAAYSAFNMFYGDMGGACFVKGFFAGATTGAAVFGWFGLAARTAGQVFGLAVANVMAFLGVQINVDLCPDSILGWKTPW